MNTLFDILRVCDEANTTESLTSAEVLTALRIAIAAGMGEYATQLLATFIELEGADADIRESVAAGIYNQVMANPGIHRTH